MISDKQIEAVFPEMVTWRRYLHQYPELSFQEKNTSRWISERLQEWGIEPVQGKNGHHVTATIRGNSTGPTIALRADIDALPIQDQKKVEYASKVDGVMHACGHDGHTAALLATAKLLQQHRHSLAGNVRLIFQHAEELCPGGAGTVIEEGGLNDVDYIYGIHLWTPLSYGKIATNDGAFMAAADEFHVEVKGKGGHGGLPHETVDSIACASQLVVNLQAIVSRFVNPLKSAVVSVGSMHGGDSFNVIAESCQLKGTVRSFSHDVREQVRSQLEDICRHTATMYGAKAEVFYQYGYPPLVNDSKEAERVVRIGSRLLGSDRVDRELTVMAAEDFAYYLQQVPGCFMFVGAGAGDPEEIVPHHHPHFDFEERAMMNAVRMFTAIVSDHMHTRN